MKRLAGQVAAITGAASGMGRELALALARRGCPLALCDVDEAGLAATASAAAALGARVSQLRVDVADREAVEAWAREAVATHGAVQLLFNNAGVSLAAPLETLKPADLDWIMRINFRGVVHGCQAFLPALRAAAARPGAEPSHIVNTSSLFGLMAMPGSGAYNASKFAVRGYTEALRMELAIAGARVGVTCVHPGGVRTNIARAARVDPQLQALTGEAPAASLARFDRLLDRTPAAAAAARILRGVERDERRVLIGADARLLDALVRLLGSAYQRPIEALARWQRGR